MIGLYNLKFLIFLHAHLVIIKLDFPVKFRAKKTTKGYRKRIHVPRIGKLLTGGRTKSKSFLRPGSSLECLGTHTKRNPKQQ